VEGGKRERLQAERQKKKISKENEGQERKTQEKDF